jgi:hypothetical protein
MVKGIKLKLGISAEQTIAGKSSFLKIRYQNSFLSKLNGNNDHKVDDCLQYFEE